MVSSSGGFIMFTQSLDGEWQLRHSKRREWIPATVPGNVHLDLLEAGVIPDPFVSDNELRVQWVAETDWVYRRKFEAAENLFTGDRIYLECDGLDTVSEVCLNGKCIAATDNMFICHCVDVTNA